MRIIKGFWSNLTHPTWTWTEPAWTSQLTPPLLWCCYTPSWGCQSASAAASGPSAAGVPLLLLCTSASPSHGPYCCRRPFFRTGRRSGCVHCYSDSLRSGLWLRAAVVLAYSWRMKGGVEEEQPWKFWIYYNRDQTQSLWRKYANACSCNRENRWMNVPQTEV